MNVHFHPFYTWNVIPSSHKEWIIKFLRSKFQIQIQGLNPCTSSKSGLLYMETYGLKRCYFSVHTQCTLVQQGGITSVNMCIQEEKEKLANSSHKFKAVLKSNSPGDNFSLFFPNSVPREVTQYSAPHGSLLLLLVSLSFLCPFVSSLWYREGTDSMHSSNASDFFPTHKHMGDPWIYYTPTTPSRLIQVGIEFVSINISR